MREIVNLARQYSESIYEKFPKGLTYHSLGHTNDVVSAVTEIGENSDLSEKEVEILQIAAWFHDLGYMEQVKGHEEVSVDIARKFLEEHDYPKEDIDRVAGCIMATQMPQDPKNFLEMVMCDADLLHLAGDHFFERSGQLQEEMKHTKGEEVNDAEWLKMNIQFIDDHEFFTDYAKKNYSKKKKKNLKKVKKRLKEEDQKTSYIIELEEDVDKLKEKVKKVKALKPDRGIETMFRLTSKNHLDLSAMADNKANIMISINSIILSIMISVLYRKLEEYPHLTVPALIITVVCLVTIVISILATRPNITHGRFSREDIQKKRTNLLFFGNFHKMQLDEYEWAMREMLNDAEFLYGSLIRDIYFLGVVLGKKYKLLRLGYTFFMFGFVIAVLSFIIAEMFFKTPYPY